MWWIAVANVVAWAVFHTATGYAAHRLPVRWLQQDGPLRRIRGWEPRLYEGVLRVRRWKDRVPEAGALFAGGISKRHVTRRDLATFVTETRRAEAGHAMAALCGPLAILWNPPAGAVAMVAYGVLVNLPFIVIQRYNRARALRALGRSSGTRPAVSGSSRTSGSSIP